MKNLYPGTKENRNLVFLYHRDSYAREYRFDEEGVDLLMSRPDFPAELAGVLRRLRLINTRNRLTHALMQAVLASTSALEEIKVLKGILPICMHCKKIRDDTGYWSQLELYIRDHSDADFSHGICPDCLIKHYPTHLNKDIKSD